MLEEKISIPRMTSNQADKFIEHLKKGKIFGTRHHEQEWGLSYLGNGKFREWNAVVHYFTDEKGNMDAERKSSEKQLTEKELKKMLMKNYNYENMIARLRDPFEPSPIISYKSTEINFYWFGEINQETGMPKEPKFDLWFGKNEETDKYLTDKYKADLEKAKIGDYENWKKTPKSLISLVILLDQFSRNIYRDTAKMYEADEKVLKIAKKPIKNKQEKEMPTVHKIFLYMPLMHSEKLEDQEQCIQLFEKLYEKAHPKAKKTLKKNIKYAKVHRDVIKEFGRFPHRNKILGRKSTKAELEYLKKPDAGF